MPNYLGAYCWESGSGETSLVYSVLRADLWIIHTSCPFIPDGVKWLRPPLTNGRMGVLDQSRLVPGTDMHKLMHYHHKEVDQQPLFQN
jgi:hypothetical protein